MSDELDAERPGQPRKERGRDAPGTASVLAKLLSTEGWTDHLANECDRYIRNERIFSARQLSAMPRIQDAGARILHDLPAEQRLVVGKFIAMHKGMAFEAGLRVGLGTSIHRIGEEET